jgi:hypothetical protein
MLLERSPLPIGSTLCTDVADPRGAFEIPTNLYVYFATFINAPSLTLLTQ